MGQLQGRGVGVDVKLKSQNMTRLITVLLLITPVFMHAITLVTESESSNVVSNVHL